jgi:outer membrane protein OmpA-like peptidoglycan-associated protein
MKVLTITSKLLSCFVVLLCFSTSAFSQNFMVRVGAFLRAVPEDYYATLGANVSHRIDHNNIHHYFLTGFRNEADAKKAAEEAIALGFKAAVLNVDLMMEQCSQTCGKADAITLRSIFFDYNSAELRIASQDALKRLVDYLLMNPKHTVEFDSHTDAKGTEDYNKKLAERRAMAAKDYITARKVTENRCKIVAFGESAPIAKNTIEGKDTEVGRQLNRRIEIKILDDKGREIIGAVEEILIPERLKALSSVD